ncbi:YkgJ family cysteine cluster protein [Dyella sp.]|uniref:YkgJ family cysteine cluster protein n=1 Tax=Dyella sp. TaxID=1869338 RepID=UPI002ED0D0F4
MGCAPGGARFPDPMDHPCLRCGACCAFFRVAFHWSEAEAFMGGVVPVELTEPLDPHRLVMRGTQARRPHCVALHGEVGSTTSCGIYERRPSVCREVQPSWENGVAHAQCERARIGHGLAPLQPADWTLSDSAPVG